MGKSNKIVVEAIVDAPVEKVWAHSQRPELHLAWDIRFSDISYRQVSEDEDMQWLDYRTKIGFGICVAGVGKYLQNVEHELSTFEFDSDDWKSLITRGKGIWLYEKLEGKTFFKTVFDYDTRFGPLGALFDRVLFRPLFCLATEWGFETLRLWCEGDPNAPTRRRRKLRFLAHVVRRAFAPAKPGCARGWLGTGKKSEAASSKNVIQETAPE